MKTAALREIELTGLPFVRRGKVREIFRAGDDLLFVASDRISAFDVILNQGIPGKGRILNKMSAFWLRLLSDVTDHHMITDRIEEMPEAVQRHADILADRCMLVRTCKPYPVECIVRGYLAGSGYKDYQATGKVCGITLPPGLVNGSRLEKPIFTPSTKAESGHDENIPFAEMERILGKELAAELRDKSLAIYTRARAHAEARGIIIADTKLEWGEIGGKTVLIDEILTPDSSRFWPGDDYTPGKPQPSFDKQIVRDWLETTGWGKTPPPPDLPDEIVQKTSRAYEEIFDRLSRS